MKGYGQVALRAVADSLDFLVDMKVYFKVYEVMGARMEGNTLLRTNQYKYNGKEIGNLK